MAPDAHVASRSLDLDQQDKPRERPPSPGGLTLHRRKKPTLEGKLAASRQHGNVVEDTDGAVQARVKKKKVSRLREKVLVVKGGMLRAGGRAPKRTADPPIAK